MSRRKFGGAVLGAATLVLTGPGLRPAGAAPIKHRVEIRAFKYLPAELTVRAGDSVEWLNLDLVPHTATDTEYEWDTEELVKDAGAEIVFAAPGEFPYFCVFHPNMKARVTVT